MRSSHAVSLVLIVLAASYLTCALEIDEEEDYIPLPRPYSSGRALIRSKHHCIRQLYRVHGERPGFKGWKQQGKSGYIVMSGYMYLFYSCPGGQYTSHYFIPPPRPY